MPKQGAKRRKTRTHKEDLEEDVKMPRSFIIHRKKIKGPIKELLKNTREVMYP
jgi:ribosome biogenesis protein SSF1/2